MEAIKKVFKHDDSNTSPSGHFKTTDESTSHSASHPSNTPNHAKPSAAAGLVEKVAGVDPSHAAGARSDAEGNRHSTGTHVAGSRDTPPHNNPVSSTSNGFDSERSSGLTGSHHDHSSHSHSHEGVAGKAERAVEQHAIPPKHSHNIPTEHTHLDAAHAKEATHDHKHLAPVTHEKHQVHETEEVIRQREVDNHIHHVQHHVQPVLDTQHSAEVHHEQVHPTTRIEEKHASTERDIAALASLNKHHDKHEELAKDRVVVDKGEVVNQRDIHHVHHVVAPVIERDTHEHHTIHTTIPVHQTTHNAPVVHQSVEHEPMRIGDFVKGGGDLKSNLTHESSGILSEGDCGRKVDGPAEGLLEKLHLKSSDHHGSSTGTSGSHGLTGNHHESGSHGLTGNHQTGSHGLTGNHGTSGVASGINPSQGLTNSHNEPPRQI